ncbi:MAG: PKD domain-containing protein [Cytophagales bacterium]|nr:PKD domain-containing protein [Cytophagales bacterium]
MKLKIYFLLLCSAYGSMSQNLNFIENKGQWADSVLFAADMIGGRALVSNEGISFIFADPKVVARVFDHAHDLPNAKELINEDIDFSKVSLQFIGSKYTSGIGLKPSQTLYNYFLGADERNWASGCHSYESVVFENLYEGIDLKIYSSDKNLKYDFIAHPGANINDIQIKYAGVRDLEIKGKEIRAETRFGQLTERAPMVYQNGASTRKQIEASFKINKGKVGFKINEYDKSTDLIIDPELIFSTFSGVTSDNFGYTACFDDRGNLYSGGIIFGTGLPATNGSGFGGGVSDIAILKYDSTGSFLEYATFLGGNSEDVPLSLIVNNNGELVILGSSGSTDFPTSATAYDRTYNGGSPFALFGPYNQGADIVLTKLDASGNLVSSTYVGSSGNDGVLLPLSGVGANALIRNYGDHNRGDIFTDSSDNVYVASSTNGTDFPINSTLQTAYGGGNSDGVVFSLNSDLSALRWSSYIGGIGDDAALSIKLDSKEDLFVGGGTTSTDFVTKGDPINPSFLGSVDGFISKISTSGDSLISSTMLGTPAYDQVYFIDIDEDDNAYAFGQTKGNYPVTEGVFTVPNSGQFIHKLDGTLSTTIFSTVFGSGTLEPNISPTAFLANECGNILLSGWGGVVNSDSSPNAGNTFNMPITPDADFPTTDGSDFYLMVLSADANELLYGTYFGSTNSTGDHVDGGTSRFDKRGIIYQSVCSCGGGTDNFPTTAGAYSNTNNGVNANGVPRCNNASFKYDLSMLSAKMKVTDEGNNEVFTGCAPLTLNFQNLSLGGVDVLWKFGDGEVSSEDFSTHTFENSGSYDLELIISDPTTCVASDTARLVIQAFPAVNGMVELDEVTICQGEQIVLQASGGVDYAWFPNEGLSASNIPNPIASPDDTTNYTINIFNSDGCFDTKIIKVNVTPEIIYDFNILRTNYCAERSVYQFESNLNLPDEVLWDFGDGSGSGNLSAFHVYDQNDEYDVTLSTGSDYPCIEPVTITLLNDEVFVPNVFSPNGDGINDSFVIRSLYRPSLLILKRTGEVVFESTSYKNNWDGGGLKEGTYYYSLKFPKGEVCNGWVEIKK